MPEVKGRLRVRMPRPPARALPNTSSEDADSRKHLRGGQNHSESNGGPESKAHLGVSRKGFS